MRQERKLTNVTIEEYIEASGGMASFLDRLNDLARANGLDWLRYLEPMMTEVEHKARFFSRMGIWG